MTETSVPRFAHTRIQLFEQLQAAGYAAGDLELVRRAHDLATVVHAGRLENTGTPFLDHTVGVASIMAWLEQPGPVVAASLLHSAYRHGDFGEGPLDLLANLAHFLLGRFASEQRTYLYSRELPWYRGWRAETRLAMCSPVRRRRVRRDVGADVEAIVFRFTAFRWWENVIPEIARRLDALDRIDRVVVLLRLANELERTLHGTFLYHARAEWFLAFIRSHGDSTVEMAGRLGQPRLAGALSDGYRMMLSTTVPRELRGAPRREQWSYSAPPRSGRLRWGAALRNAVLERLP